MVYNFDLNGAYDLIVGKKLAREDTTPSGFKQHPPPAGCRLDDTKRWTTGVCPQGGMMGLRAHQGRCRDVHTYYTAVARAASINLISAQQTVLLCNGPREETASPESSLWMYDRETIQPATVVIQCLQTLASGESKFGKTSPISSCLYHSREKTISGY